MKDFKVFYTTKEQDHCKVWVEAESKEDAKMVAREENWDIDTIGQVLEM